MDLSGFKLNRTIVDVDLSSFISLIQDTVNNLSKAEHLIAEDCNFYSNEEFVFDDKRVPSYQFLADTGIGILDYFLCDLMYRNPEHRQFCVWKRYPKTLKFDSKMYSKAIFVLYFLLITRAKPFLGEKEQMPKFITTYCSINMTKEEYHLHLGTNDFNKLDHKWIRKVVWEKVSSALITRLVSGIAGTRFFNLIKNNKPNKENIEPSIMKIYDLVKRVAERGPYWSQHPFFHPKELQGVSVMKNLSNLMLDLYTEKTLGRMVAVRSLFAIPIADERYTQYRSWSEDFLSLYKDDDRILVNNKNITQAEGGKRKTGSQVNDEKIEEKPKGKKKTTIKKEESVAEDDLV